MNSHVGKMSYEREKRLKKLFDIAVKIIIDIEETSLWPMNNVNHIIDYIKISQDPIKMSHECEDAQDQYRHYAEMYQIVDEGDYQTLLFKNGTMEGDVENIQKIAPLEKLYDIIKKAHVKTAHGNAKHTSKILQISQYFIPLPIIEIYHKYCVFCVFNTIKYNICDTRGQVELINMEEFPDGEFKYILFYRDEFSCMTFLRPLMTKSIDEIALNLLKIFLEFGCPIVLHSQLGEKFTTAIAERTELVWPKTCKILKPKAELYPMGGQIMKQVNSVKESLECWMYLNDTACWAIGVYFVQYQLNSIQQGLCNAPFKLLIDRDKQLSRMGDDLFNMKTENDLRNYLKCETERKIKIASRIHSDNRNQEDKTSQTQINKSAFNDEKSKNCEDVKCTASNISKSELLQHDFVLINKKKKMDKQKDLTLTVNEYLGLPAHINNNVTPSHTTGTIVKINDDCKKSSKNYEDIDLLPINIMQNKTQLACKDKNRVRNPKRKLAHETNNNEKISETCMETSVNENVATLINEAECERLITSRTHPNEESPPSLESFKEKSNIEAHESIEKSNKIEQASNKNYCSHNKAETYHDSRQINDGNLSHKNLLEETSLTNIKRAKFNKTPPLKKIDTIRHTELSYVYNKLETNKKNSEYKSNSELSIAEEIDTINDFENSSNPAANTKCNLTSPPTKIPLDEKETVKHQKSTKVNLETNKESSETDNIGFITNNTGFKKSMANATQIKSEHVELIDLNNEPEISLKSIQIDSKGLTNNDVNCNKPKGNNLETDKESCEKTNVDLITQFQDSQTDKTETDREPGKSQTSSQNDDISGLIYSDTNLKSPTTRDPKYRSISPLLFEEIETTNHEVVTEENLNQSNSKLKEKSNDKENLDTMYHFDVCRRPEAQKTYLKREKIQTALKPLEKTKNEEKLMEKNKNTQALMKVKSKMAHTDNYTTYIDLEETQSNLKPFDTVETFGVPEESIKEKCMWMLQNIKSKMAHEPKLDYYELEINNESSKNEKNIVLIDDDTDEVDVEVDESETLNCDTTNLFNGDDIDEIYDVNNMNGENIDWCIRTHDGFEKVT